MCHFSIYHHLQVVQFPHFCLLFWLLMHSKEAQPKNIVITTCIQLIQLLFKLLLFTFYFLIWSDKIYFLKQNRWLISALTVQYVWIVFFFKPSSTSPLLAQIPCLWNYWKSLDLYFNHFNLVQMQKWNIEWFIQSTGNSS